MLSSSTVRSPTKKRKKPAALLVQRVRTLPPVSPSSPSTSSSLSSSSPLASSSEPEIGVDQVVPPIIYEEEEEEEDIASNLRTGFHKRQHKRLSKSIVVNFTFSKKACPEPILALTPGDSTTPALVGQLLPQPSSCRPP